MKKIFNRYLAILMVTFAAFAGVAMNVDGAHAIETTLTVSPMEQKMTLYPGESSTGSVTVSNQASATEPLYYTVSVAPFTRSGNNYDPMIGAELSDGAYNDIVNWVTLSSESGKLEPNERDEITYTVNVPENVRGGGQYFAILVTRVDGPGTNEAGGNSASLKEIIQIASTAYATVSGGDMNLAGSINDNNISTFFLSPPINASFTANNTGNVHMDIDYYLQVYPLFSGEEVYTNEENPSHAIVLPGTSRYISQEWSEAPQIGIFKVRQTVMFGSDDSQKSVTEKMVIVCPIWLLFIIFFVIAAIIIWIVMRVRGRNKAARRSSAAKTTE